MFEKEYSSQTDGEEVKKFWEEWCGITGIISWKWRFFSAL